ncbi:hypothetical protein DPMN_086093 [Dreissena polymorpha]|uniref:Neurotransmitter-gated ion-channel transmembrane domain-containing protein n=1 Tax=Dreissena polymorpha TaxID=45954 RepID=A0A9D4BJZ4_DREPO|nr:hypothetical protein DPMN_086093 [Dreissena polymorpha]
MLVFLLVPESGERIAYCITVLLSIAVFVTIVSAMLPRTSKPVPIISFTLMIDIAISSAITVMAILNLRIYNKDPESPVPKWMIAIYWILTCALSRKRKMGPLEMRKLFRKTSTAIRIQIVKAISKAENDNNFEKQPTDLTVRESITLKNISYMIDGVALCLVSLAAIGSFAVFMIIVTGRGK